MLIGNGWIAAWTYQQAYSLLSERLRHVSLAIPEVPDNPVVEKAILKHLACTDVVYDHVA